MRFTLPLHGRALAADKGSVTVAAVPATPCTEPEGRKVEIRLARLLLAGVLIALACPTDHAYAQASRLGDTQPLGSSSSVTEKKTAIAYDPDSDVYVIVWGLGSLQAAFVPGQGATATSALLTGIANVSGTQQSPAVAYSPDAKAFLVVWLDFRT